ncbi:MAG TPA: YfhO family protein, partial [Anaerolineae bacterium]|nr:YfhO family protein [Anaerolineae bacterium]
SQAAFQVRCDDQPCFFVFNMANVSGWHAYVDHQPAHIHQTNFAFMGIEVPQGEHLLWFEFAPIYDLGSKTISFLFFCGILGYHFIHQNQVKKQNLDSTHK